MELYIFADKEIFKVVSLSGSTVLCSDKIGWNEAIPLSRVERFCTKDGLHIDFKITADENI